MPTVNRPLPFYSAFSRFSRCLKVAWSEKLTLPLSWYLLQHINLFFLENKSLLPLDDIRLVHESLQCFVWESSALVVTSHVHWNFLHSNSSFLNILGVSTNSWIGCSLDGNTILAQLRWLISFLRITVIGKREETAQYNRFTSADLIPVDNCPWMNNEINGRSFKSTPTW